MPEVSVGGVRLHYRDLGEGEPVVLVHGAGSNGAVWMLHQVPDLVDAGYRVIVYDSRGTPPSDPGEGGFTLADLTADLGGLVEELGLAPARLVGTSMGSYVAQELALARPDLVRQVVLMSTQGRSDAMRVALAHAEIEFNASGVAPPAAYAAVLQAFRMLSPATLDDDSAIEDWLALFEAAPPLGPGAREQFTLQPMPDRLDEYAAITVPTHVIAFADDLITPPHAGRDVADAIPGATFELVADAGHLGFLENPEPVTKSILAFFGGDTTGEEPG